MKHLYILRERELVEVTTLDEWYGWFAAAGTRRIVARVEFGAVVVFTAFQGVDVPPAGPRLHDEVFPFETVVLGGPLNGARQSYGTWRDAELGHRAMVARVRAPSIIPQAAG